MFNEKLKHFVKLNKITIGCVAKAVGVSAAHLSRVAWGKRPCSLNLALKIEKYTMGYITIQDCIRELQWRK